MKFKGNYIKIEDKDIFDGIETMRTMCRNGIII